MQSNGVNSTATARFGLARAWWLDMPGMDFDHWGVMAALSTYADETGTCHPSQATLARRLKRSRPWVNRVIGDLAKIGLIRKVARTRTANPGTTSCEYTLALRPSDLHETEAPVMEETQPCHNDDTGRHHGDRNHIKTKQDSSAHPNTCDAVLTEDRKEEPHWAAAMRQGCPIPDDWQPAPGTVAAARSLAPDVDLEAHVMMFATKSRAKGYLYQAGRADDAWLAWLAEDRLKRKGHGSRACKRQPGRGRLGGMADAGDRRFASWAKAASTPRGSTPTGPARGEEENPWK